MAPFDQRALHLFPREGGLASKTQQHDDTKILDSSSRPWLGPLVNLIARTRKRDEKLFSFTIDAWRKELRRCGSEASGGDTWTSRRSVMRHSGGRCTDPVLLRILRRLAAIFLASGARFRYRWVPSELCPSDEASRWYDREKEVYAPFRTEQRQGVTLQDNISPEAEQVARLNVSSPLRKVSTSLTVGGRPSGAGPCQDSGARSKSTCEPDASKPQRARPEACTAQTFTKRCRGSPHSQALKGRTAVVLMDAGAPFAKALGRLGLVVHLLSSGNSANAAGP